MNILRKPGAIYSSVLMGIAIPLLLAGCRETTKQTTASGEETQACGAQEGQEVRIKLTNGRGTLFGNKVSDVSPSTEAGLPNGGKKLIFSKALGGDMDGSVTLKPEDIESISKPRCFPLPGANAACDAANKVLDKGGLLKMPVTRYCSCGCDSQGRPLLNAPTWIRCECTETSGNVTWGKTVLYRSNKTWSSPCSGSHCENVRLNFNQVLVYDQEEEKRGIFYNHYSYAEAGAEVQETEGGFALASITVTRKTDGSTGSPLPVDPCENLNTAFPPLARLY